MYFRIEANKTDRLNMNFKEKRKIKNDSEVWDLHNQVLYFTQMGNAFGVENQVSSLGHMKLEAYSTFMQQIFIEHLVCTGTV